MSQKTKTVEVESQPNVVLNESPSGTAPGQRSTVSGAGPGSVTLRAFGLGALLAAGLSVLNAWIEIQANVHFLGGVQMPFGAIFSLLFLILVINGPIRMINRAVPGLSKIFPPLRPTELLTIYAMLIFAALISTAGTENFFLATGPALFYFATNENRWAELFYKYIPSHFAPGWDGKVYQEKVIGEFYTGGLSIGDVPWHAWTAMLIAWGILLVLVYSSLFFFSLLMRRQWIENEALAFPLVQLPLQMVDDSNGPIAKHSFWNNPGMWGGFIVAALFHMLRGLNNYFPDWPMISAFQGNGFPITFTENPWNAMGSIGITFYFGAIGIAYLLTRELSFSFWFFFLLFKAQLVMATMAGFPANSLPKDTYLGRPSYITWQSTGGWIMMALLLLWAARGHLQGFWREAIKPRSEGNKYESEPFSPRTVLAGLILSAAGVMGWCWYSGINPVAAGTFFGIYALTSMVLARLVVEGGFLFPQLTFAPLEAMATGFMGSKLIGDASLTRLSFVQPMLFADMRSNLLPGFLHTLKISHDLKLPKRDARRLMLAVVGAVFVALAVSTITSIATVYKSGGLTGYTWFTQSGPQWTFQATAAMLREPTTIDFKNLGWMGTGMFLVWAMTFARARFMWFPFHPLAFIISSGYPITQLWPSFFVGWLVKTLLLRFGGQDSVGAVRPMMIGLILGNAVAMVIWMIYGFFAGTQIGYWPA
jgi:hypothetical protein